MASASRLEERLERGELVYFPRCPFPLPGEAELAFLREQRVGYFHKNISYDPASGSLSGYRRRRGDPASLEDILHGFGEQAAGWVREALPGYRAGLRRDRVSFRPEEEATRRLRLHARNDLLHIDAFPSRPTGGARILRLYVNVHPEDVRVWATSYTFEALLQRYGGPVGLPGAPAALAARVRRRLLGLVRGGPGPGSDFDRFMLRLHNYLKMNDAFQEHCPKKYWKFAPGSAWLAFTDALSHAELRGRYALEHSFFVPLDCLRLPELAPANLLAGGGRPLPLGRAA